MVTGDSKASTSRASAGVLYQEVEVAESTQVRIADPVAGSIVTTDVLVISEADNLLITQSLCMSSLDSANLRSM